MLKKQYQQFIIQDHEPKIIGKLLTKYLPLASSCLDVGCGYGRNMRLLQSYGYTVTGVEKNSDIVEYNQSQGLNCFSIDDFHISNKQQYDCIIMSHIIEHFNPLDLFHFMDTYLDLLKPQGLLIIATPLMTEYFYDDYDHVKPYHPTGIQMVFGKETAQVQYQSRNKLALKDIWFRKSPRISTLLRSKYIRTSKRYFVQIYDLFQAVLFKITLGLTGRRDGWVGLFQKV